MPTTESPFRASRIPITPAASRPIARTSSSWKRASLPWAVAMMTSSSPVEMSTQASSSLSSIVIARMPVERSLLDLALSGGQHQVAAGCEVLEGDRRHRDLAGLDLDPRQVDDRDALR